MQGLFRSAELPVGERLAAASELFGRGTLPMRLATRADSEFDAVVRHVELAPLRVMELAVTPAAVLRTQQLIRRGDPEMLSVLLPLGGGLTVAQAGRQTAVGRDQFALYDSSLPFEIGFAPAGGWATVISAHVPRSRLPLAHFDQLLARPLPAGRGSGFGGLLAHVLTDVAGAADSFLETDRARLGGIAGDLLTAMLAHHLQAEGRVPEHTRHATLLLSIEAFIQQHLPDPSLTPAAIAAAHHISLSHLHRLFRARDTPVAAWIRRQRLERARKDLADPALRQVPVHRIASRWGFTSHSTFTRAFRAAYGTAPRDHHQAAPAPGVAPS